jgi:hypothetical protein
VRIAVLGPLEVDDGRIVVAPRKQVVLQALAARPGEVVRAEARATGTPSLRAREPPVRPQLFALTPEIPRSPELALGLACARSA